MPIDEEAVRQTAQDLKDMGIGDYSSPAPPVRIVKPEKDFLTKEEEEVFRKLVWNCSSDNGRLSTAKNFIGNRYISPEVFGRISGYMTSDKGRQALTLAFAGRVLTNPDKLKMEKVATAGIAGMVLSGIMGTFVGGLLMLMFIYGI